MLRHFIIRRSSRLDDKAKISPKISETEVSATDAREREMLRKVTDVEETV